jgi:putative Mg2+ transporter-C (MgtC) family protein
MPWNFLLNIGCALLLGVAIGLERQWRLHSAGLRTNTLVTLGSAIYVALGPLLGAEGDTARLAGQVVTGLGFLGGGVIMREGFTVRGLNTAATLWCAGGVGALAGAGQLAAAATASGAVLVLHIALRPLALLMEARLHGVAEIESRYRVSVTCRQSQAALVRATLLGRINAEPRTALNAVGTDPADAADHQLVVADFQSCERKDQLLEDLVARVNVLPGVKGVHWERRNG